jgi:hypothetical protein
MLAARYLRDHPVKGGMEGYLCRHNIGTYPFPVFHHRGGALIAGGLDAKDSHDPMILGSSEKIAPWMMSQGIYSIF